ncbi:MAG: glycogen/starch synthase [Flammeovirgaceae bacterium]
MAEHTHFTEKKHLIDPQKKISPDEMFNTLLIEAAWEVCNQVGGIYTVIRSKVPSVVNKWGKQNYCLLGPYVGSSVSAVFEPIHDYSDPYGKAVLEMRQRGYEVHYGYWLVSGRPRVVLFNPYFVFNRINDIKWEMWDHHKIPTPPNDELINKCCALGYQIYEFLKILSKPEIKGNFNIIAHFHEWMASTHIPEIRRANLPIQVVFTTHATLLGRYLAMNDPVFYEYMPFYDWEKEAKHFNIESQVKIERAAAHGSHVFTTVSEVTGRECQFLLGREPDVILPNGLNIERFEALHEFQNLHLKFKRRINHFVMGHFFQSYTFDLDNTIYFFTSGRYEYHNKGFDMVLESLARLNYKMRTAGIEKTVICFFITKQPTHTINPDVLQSRNLMEEVQYTCDSILEQIGKKLFQAATLAQDNKLPDLNKLVDDYWALRLRRTLQSWRTSHLPSIITHNLVDDSKDEILNFLRSANLINKPEDRVKVVYHPDFVSPVSPLFGMEYGQFVRGCHLGIFPSYYEPWGYTPLECIASGVPAVTSDLSGFGDYVMKNMPNHETGGVYVVKRRHGNFDQSANQLTDVLFNFVKMDRRQRIAQRNAVEQASVSFDWENLGEYYDLAYKEAIKRR